MEARIREKEPEIDPKQMPHPEVKIDESFLQRNETLLGFLAASLAKTALEQDNAIDIDVREALEGLVRTYRTRQSGLFYESRPDNPIAARIQSRVQELIREVEEEDLRQSSSARLKDSDILGVLVFFQRIEMQKNNRRRKSRAFIDFLHEFLPPEEPTEESSLLIL
jgi:hypothetical protein